jgi:hypothetical protein
MVERLDERQSGVWIVDTGSGAVATSFVLP